MQPARKRIQTAFVELLASTEYMDITVALIIDKAEVSKATFYRHYQRKLDLFIEIHHARIDSLLVDLNTEQDWLADTPPQSAIQVGLQAASAGARRATMAYKLGNEWPMAVRMLKEQMISAIELRLTQAFGERLDAASTAPFVAAMYMDFMVQLNQTPSQEAATKKATLLHRFSRAIVLDALAQQQ